MPAPDLLPSPSPVAAADDIAPRYRSGAVARMVRMPVATLRIWERRYRLTTPATTATGHRLYSADDVRRLALLKQLTDLGHAIGAIAALDMHALRQVATTHASTIAGARSAPASAAMPWRVAVVGAALARRLQRSSVLRRLGRALELIGPFDNLAQACEARSGAQAATQVDALLMHAAGLHEGSLSGLQEAAAALGAPQMAVLFGYAAAPVCDALAAAGVALLREPQADAALGHWLHGLGAAASGPVLAIDVANAAVMTAEHAPPRRYDDATLADFAGLSSTIACECPRHVAELLMQLSHFEAYCAECAQRSPDDAALHAYLRQVAGGARALFEAALERVAIHEGLMLPAP